MPTWNWGLKKREEWPQLTGEMLYLIHRMATHWVVTDSPYPSMDALHKQRSTVQTWVLEHYEEDKRVI